MGCAGSKDATSTKRVQHRAPAGHQAPGYVAPAHPTPAPVPVRSYASAPPAAGRKQLHQPPVRSTKVAPTAGSGRPCEYFKTGYCRMGTSCPNLHDNGSAAGSGKPRAGTSGKPCQYFLAGHCRLGDNCGDVHYEDSGPPPAAAGDYPPPSVTGVRGGQVDTRPICQAFMGGNCHCHGCMEQHPVGLGGTEGTEVSDSHDNASFTGPAPPRVAAGGRSTPPSKYPCQFFLQGFCRLGEQCPDAHPAEMEGWGRGDTTDLQAILEQSRQEEENRQLEEARKRGGGGGGGYPQAPPLVGYPNYPQPPPASSYPAPPPASGGPGGFHPTYVNATPNIPPPLAAAAAAGGDGGGASAGPSCGIGGQTLAQVMVENPMSVFPTFSYHATTTDKAKARDDPSLSCSICICEFEAEEQMMMLPCMHRFHASCVAAWVKKHPTCPICNADVTRTGSILFIEEN